MSADTTFLDTLLHVIRTLRRSYDQRARDVGLTLSRARALGALARHHALGNPPVTQAELAAELSIEPPTLKRQIDALVADGFVARQPLAGDARKNALVLTARGRDSAIAEHTDHLRREVLRGIPPEDLDQAARTLARIAQNLDRLSRD